MALDHEEEAVLWLWAFPFLVPWHCPIHWLFTLVTGNEGYPGDLWGIADDGDLIMLECKKRRSSDCSPFKDFWTNVESGSLIVDSEDIRDKWHRARKEELEQSSALDARPTTRPGGLLPRSRERRALHHWPELTRIVDGYIRSPMYEAGVLRGLDRRSQANGDMEAITKTQFLGYVYDDSKKGDPTLPRRAKDDESALAKLVGPERVWTLECTAEPMGANVRVGTVLRSSEHDGEASG